MDRATRDIDHLEQILELIADITRRTGRLDRSSFESDRDESDLAAFRLAHIGEATHKLSNEVKQRHPGLDWRSIYGMRNIIAHDYGAILPGLLWTAIQKDLDVLAAMCRDELEQLGQ